MADVTRLLQQIDLADPQSTDELLAIVYEELRKLAASRMAREPMGHTLEPTALVHEAYLRLVGAQGNSWNSRGHFFAAAAEAMRRILIDSARKRKASKRDGGQRIPLELIDKTEEQGNIDLIALDDAMIKLQASNPIIAKLVTFRYFGGMSIPEAAEQLSISPRTASNYWSFAKAFLLNELSTDE